MTIDSGHIKLSRRLFVSVIASAGTGIFLQPVAATEGSLFTLISDEEYTSALENIARDKTGSSVLRKTLYPTIEVESPSLGKSSISSPINIIIKFRTSADHTIDMNSLSIRYGYFMDITDRILSHAELGVDYVQASNAELPKGKHTFTIVIKDSAGREAEQEIKVVIK